MTLSQAAWVSSYRLSDRSSQPQAIVRCPVPMRTAQMPSGDVIRRSDDQMYCFAPVMLHSQKNLPRCVTLRRMRRRQFLVLSAVSLGGVLVYTLDRQPSLIAASAPSSI